MKIAVFGWYGHDNAGDERIKFCVREFLMSIGGIQEISFFDLHECASAGATNRFNSFDLVIVGGGGLVLSSTNYHDFILGLNPIVATVGISVEVNLEGNPKKFVEALLYKSSLFFVRDQESFKKISYFDTAKKVQVSADLTFLVPYETTSCKKNGPIGVNLLPKPKRFKYSTFYSPYVLHLVRLCSKVGMSNMVKVHDFKEIFSDLISDFSFLPIPLYCASQDRNLPLYQKNDIEFLKQYFDKVPDSFCPNLMDECSVFLTMRLHGSIFAVQKGIPVVSMAYLPKNRNFMTEVGLEEYVLDNSFSSCLIRELIYKTRKNRHLIREKMDIYTKKSKKMIRQHLIDVVNLVK